MVRTISNAFETGRIPQAWILTGVRGVGKTTTARILARALNYELPDGSVKGPTIDMPALGLHCQAIMESRHVDVIEMDAASHNGVDDVRQINEAVRYSPVSARYKVYILDEVHMLSTAAFNALLKTLEEPPPHVKFVFATTEIRKVPITILSRCQRFDLRRVDAGAAGAPPRGDLRQGERFGRAGGARADRARRRRLGARRALADGPGASRMRPAACAPRTCGRCSGLADRTRIIDLFEALMRGDMAKALGELRDQYDSGADPGGGALRSRRVHAFRDAREGRAGGRRRSLARRGRAHARPRFRHAALDARAVAHLADAVQGAHRGEGRRQAARGRRDGAGAHRLCGRPADAGRGDPRISQNGGACAAEWRTRAATATAAAAPRPSAAPRFDPPRGAPRASLAPAQLVTAQLPDISTLRAAEPRDACGRGLCRADRARGGEARPR